MSMREDGKVPKMCGDGQVTFTRAHSQSRPYGAFRRCATTFAH